MEELRHAESDEDLLAITHNKLSVLMTFATAVARSHPDPAALAKALELTITEDRADEIPFNDLTPSMQLGHQYGDAYEQMLLRIARNRATSAEKTDG